MEQTSRRTRIETAVIGAGQSGLSIGYHLKRRHLPFLILEANARIGENWRKRWDSLRLFTPARFDGLDGMPFPAKSWAFPTKNEMADFLEGYAARFELPVRTSANVTRLWRDNGRLVVDVDGDQMEADNVVVAMATFQRPRVPEYAQQLDPRIVQLHSSEYKNPRQLKPGAVLIVGGGNSGAEIALDVARAGHEATIAGRHVGHIPFRIEGALARLGVARVILRFVFHRLLTVDTPIGRRARPKILAHGGPLIRVKPVDLAAAGVKRVARVSGVKDGKPLLEDGTVVETTNVVWCTGFHPGFRWIDLPVFNQSGELMHEKGIVKSEPGLYFVGLNFLYSLSSTMVHGAGRDAERIAEQIMQRASAS